MKSRFSRRDFLKTGSKTLLAAAAVPYFLKSDAARAMASPRTPKQDLNFYYNRFGVDEKAIKDVMGEALSKGGDYCDIYFEHSILHAVGLEDKAVNRAYGNIDFGVGIRVLKGDQTGYSFSEEITPKAMKLAARTAANIADSSGRPGPVQLKMHKTPNYYRIKIPCEQVAIDKKIPILQKVNDKVFSLDKRVIKSNIGFLDHTSYILIATSEGRIVCDYQPMLSIWTNCTAEQDGRREQNYFDFSERCGFEFLTQKKIDLMVTEAVRRTVQLFDAVKVPGGEMELVLAAGSSGILLHEAIGHGMEADFNRKGISIFSDRIGKAVAEKFVTIVDDGTYPNLRGSINIDDEANDTEKTHLVENGILRSYLHDYISAKYYNVKPTGSGRRESFRYEPIPRMRNTYMLGGPHKKKEIIRSVKKGIYAETFTNGQVTIGAGDFTFYVKSGRLIEDGKLTKAIKDTNIIGNGPEVLKNVVMVADDLKMAEGGWTCGKNGQGVPVSQGLPTVKISKITVGGTA